ncbi:WEB family protein [Abeliophyllum distichum]|uniref:WEB family protein n=1 Tax=Abeliophyllum distichum TaxID=126358 RepID=A0ABD1SAZ3_9LAMI
MERGEEGGLVVRGRVEIDMRQPFRSVKEAVLLFGEKVLAGQVYGNKLNEVEIKERNGKNTSKSGGVTSDHHVEQRTQQTVEKAKEESNNLMVQCLNSLRQELEQTKMELQQLKSRESHIENDKQLVEPEIEELKYIENIKAEIKQENDLEFEKKRSVKFASPPLLTRLIISKDDGVKDEDQAPSPKKKPKKKPLISFMGGLFLKQRK